jgi:hypothetical protein
MERARFGALTSKELNRSIAAHGIESPT